MSTPYQSISAMFSSFEQVPEFSLDATQLKAIILHALQSLHGQVRGISYIQSTLLLIGTIF